MTDPGPTRDAPGQTASRSNQQTQQQSRQAPPPAQERGAEPTWDSSTANAQNWEPAQNAAVVPVESSGGDGSIGFEWQPVMIETNRTCSCVVSAESGHALSVRVQQPPYDRTLRGTGSVSVAAIPVAGIGAKGRLLAKDEVSGATAEFTWEWRPAAKAKWANPSRTMAKSAPAGQVQKGTIDAAKMRAGASSKTGAGANSQEKPAVQTAFFGMPATGHRFAFILDMSGSMSGSRWNACLQHLADALHGLTEDAEFFVVLFSDGLVIPTEQAQWLPATEECKKAIFEWAAGVEPGGGTYPQPAFDLVFASPEGKPDVIYFLTDGLFTSPSPDRLARQCSGASAGILSSLGGLFVHSEATAPGHTVIHTLTLDDASGASLCKKIAKATGGQYAHVSS